MSHDPLDFGLISLNEHFSVIYIETIRDSLRGRIGLPDFEERFLKRRDEIVAHELAHAPGGASAHDDHSEPGLMADGAPEGEVFSPETLMRIRETQKWNP